MMTEVESRRRQVTLAFFKYIETFGEAIAQKPNDDPPASIAPISTKPKTKQRRGWPITRIVSGKKQIGRPREPLLFITWPAGTPFVMSSVMAYNPYDVERRILLSDKNLPAPQFRPGIDNLIKSKRTESYKHLLMHTGKSHGTRSVSSESTTETSSFSSISTSSDSSRPGGIPDHYDPLFLDDPELTAGRHRTVITLPSFVSSISHYAGEEELKKDLNERFRQMHPYFDGSMTLSKIRNLKDALLKASLEVNLELATVAIAYALLEKLFIAGHVVKTNRRLVGACCLLLAVKSFDCREPDIHRLLASLSAIFTIPEGDIVKSEFSVFASLAFTIHLPQLEYLPHFERLFSALEYSNFQEYLGERMYSLWTRDA